MSTTTYFGSTEAQAARSLIGGTAIGDTRNELLKQILVATANKTSGPSGVAWGAITGTLGDQTDLADALAAKLDLTGGTMTGALVNSQAIAAATQADGVQLLNTTAATSGNQTWSPSLRLTGNQWASGASRTCEGLLTLVPVEQNFDHTILRFQTKHGANALANVLDIRAYNGFPYIEPGVPGTSLTLGGSAGNSALNFQFNGIVVAQFNTSTAFALTDGVNIAAGTTNGTKIGESTSQKLGFWNTTPVVQQVLPTGSSTDTVITFLQTIGLCRQS